MDMLETIGRIRPALIAAVIAFLALAFSLFDELGGFAIEHDQDDRSLAIGLLFTLIWLLLLYFPPEQETFWIKPRKGKDDEKGKGKARGQDKGSQNGSDSL